MIILKILLPALIQGTYDFIGWFGIIKEYPKKRWHEWLYRFIKDAILDFPLTIFIFHLVGYTFSEMAAFYIFKWFHGCDSVYNIWSYIFRHKPSEIGFWRWWTPVGLYRTIKLTIQNKKFTKGLVSLNECWIQTAIGFVLALLTTCLF